MRCFNIFFGIGDYWFKVVPGRPGINISNPLKHPRRA
jgi:hypothetical protein